MREKGPDEENRKEQKCEKNDHGRNNVADSISTRDEHTYYSGTY